MAVFQARAATRPSAVVISSANLSRTSPVNGISFRSLFVPLRLRGSVSVHAVLGVGAQEIFDRVDVPPDDNFRGVPVEARPDAGLPPDAAPAVLQGGLAGPSFQPVGVYEPARTAFSYHQQIQPQPSGGSNAAIRSNKPASFFFNGTATT